MQNSKGEPEAWWFNTKTNSVEFGRLSHALDRIGPFSSESEAKDALKIIRERATAWRSEEEGEA